MASIIQNASSNTDPNNTNWDISADNSNNPETKNERKQDTDTRNPNTNTSPTQQYNSNTANKYIQADQQQNPQNTNINKISEQQTNTKDHREEITTSKDDKEINNEGIDIDSIFTSTNQQEEKIKKTETNVLAKEINPQTINTFNSTANNQNATRPKSSTKKYSKGIILLILLILGWVVIFGIYRLMFPLGIQTNTTTSTLLETGNQLIFEEESTIQTGYIDSWSINSLVQTASQNNEIQTGISITGINQQWNNSIQPEQNIIMTQNDILTEEIKNSFINQFQKYSTKGKELFELGRLTRDSDMVKYWLFIEKKSLDQLDILASEVNIDIPVLEAYIKQFDEYIQLLEEQTNANYNSSNEWSQ